MRKGSLPLLLASLLTMPMSMAEPNTPVTLPITIQTGNPHTEELTQSRQQPEQSERQADNSEQDSALINRLRQENQRLKLQLKQALAQPVSGQLLTEQQAWFATGAGVAVLAFLIGSFTGGRRNKRKSQWV